MKLAIIGGSGLYQMDGAKLIDEKEIRTPFGRPSDLIKIVEFNGTRVAFLPRHGSGHRISPSEIPVKANVWALKSLGIESVLAISAVGSLKEEFAPRDFVIPDQIIDRTQNRENTFFTEGLVGHISFAEPFCSIFSKLIFENLKTQSKVHFGGTYLCMEGPAFSTRAESRMYQKWGAEIIGMTALPEAKLVREAEMAYAMIAMVTDYDSWKEEESVDVTHVIGHMKHNVNEIKKSLPGLVSSIPQFVSPAHTASQFAIMTDKHAIPEQTIKKTELFFGKYWK